MSDIFAHRWNLTNLMHVIFCIIQISIRGDSRIYYSRHLLLCEDQVASAALLRLHAHSPCVFHRSD